MKPPRITVVTPSYNQAPFLEQAIESVLAQNYPDLEYMVLDGGSTDGSVEIIRKYERYLAYWTSERDQGQADAVNRGWPRATGEILAFLNSDDYYFAGALERVARTFLEHPEAGVVHGQGEFVDVAGEGVQVTAISFASPQQMADVLGSLPQPATFIRRSVIDRIGYLDISMHYGLDKDFYLRAAANFPVVTIAERLAALRMHPEAKSVRNAKAFLPDLERIVEKMLAHPGDYPLFDHSPARVESAGDVAAAQFLYMAAEYRAAMKLLIRAARRSPAHRSIVLRRELPRCVLRGIVGREAYVRLSGATAGWRQRSRRS